MGRSAVHVESCYNPVPCFEVLDVWTDRDDLPA